MDFESNLSDIVNRYQSNGVTGTKFTTKSYTGETILTDTDMTKEVFNLGVALKDEPTVTPHKWAAWMRDSHFTQLHDKVVFKMRSKFFCENAAYRFKDVLEGHFGKPVAFEPCKYIKQQVNHRIAA